MQPVHVHEKTNQMRAHRWGRIMLATGSGMLLVFMITITLLTAPTITAHVTAPPPRNAMVHGDRLYVTHQRNGCSYIVHFTLSREMQNARSYRVSGPDHTNPMVQRVRGRDADARYNRNVHSCSPDRRNRASQFELQAFR
jgi:hypothetical protein